ncbi:flagellar biosynthesis protein FlgN [Sphingomonas sp. C3-2]|uniref:flagellar biosynthesis protein FlgN n=1 Tax=Sphingomonas sp. C3-2 TaxID=3062169 RepID=UPI00294B2715|nr:flagellar biosynthesis protein FlgN [Sphingomonas sp. C3-2]WOK37717.1 flagellar biosynthesis protein FlgN [Sphingomonas sp. C3-2]
MASEIIDIMVSLTLIMQEETQRLTTHERAGDLAELANAKVRLVGVLETELARLNREESGWVDAMDEEGREALGKALVALGEASTANADILERNITLSIEMMEAVTNEAKRISGNRAEIYGAKGNVSRIELATPISVNSEI